MSNNNKKRKVLLLALAISFGLLVLVVVLGLIKTSKEESGQEVELEMDLGNGMIITQIGGYSGKYVEDGTDEDITDVLMLRVENRGEDAIEYAVVNLQMEENNATFTVSALMPGAEAVLLEKNRMIYSSDLDYSNAIPSCMNFAKYQYELMLYEDQIDIQLLDGAVNVTNISGKNIDDNVTIYYKNKENGAFLGGIAYRITIEGGLGIGEIKQKMAKHILTESSEILFVTMTK